jgi:hypothetical protein
VASDGAATRQFGSSVAISGSTVFVGPYVFTQPGGTWTQQQKLAANDGTSFDFSTSVSASGGTVVIGVPGAVVNSNANQGAAYVFTQSGSIWVQQGSSLVASDGVAENQFGFSVATSGDAVFVGAPYRSVGGYDEGAAYIFQQAPGGWTQVDELIPADGTKNGCYGSA